MNQDDLRQQILKLVDQYAQQEYAEKIFIPGETPIPPSGKLLGSNELKKRVENYKEMYPEYPKIGKRPEDRQAHADRISIDKILLDPWFN